MEEIKLDVQIRNGAGTRHAKRVRRQDFIPGVIYGVEEKTTKVQVDRRTFERIERQHRGESVLLHLNVMEGDQKKEDYSTLIKEIQANPVSDQIIHVDFQRISLTEKIEVKVPLVTKGEPVGVKQGGGSLDHLLWELDVICLPTQIPQKIVTDVSHLQINDSVLVKDLLLPEGVTTEHDPEAIVFTVAPPSKEEPEAAPAEGEEVITEPEVLKEKKEKKEEMQGKAPAEEKAPKEKAPKEKAEG